MTLYMTVYSIVDYSLILVVRQFSICLQNYQSTFYQTSGETEADEDEEKLLPLAINVHPSSVGAHRGSHSSGPIFPRSTPLSPTSYQTSPWLRTLPSQSQSVRSVGLQRAHMGTTPSSNATVLKTASHS